ADFVSALDQASEGSEQRSPRRMATIALGALVILGGAVVAGRRLGQSPGGGAGSVTPGRERKLSQLTVADGVEEWPAWSPDGTRLVYTGELRGCRQSF